jgi:sulfur-carrier protein
MPRVVFTRNLQRHVECPAADVVATTVCEALERVFSQNERLRGYVLDEHGALRKHMLVFINGNMIQDRQRLSDPVAADAEVYVFQALSGG